MSYLIDSSNTLGRDVDGNHVRISQEVPEDFLSDLKSERLASVALRANEYHRVASVPVAVYDIWMRQGLDPFRWSRKELVAHLIRDGLDAFITTNKAL